MSLHYFHAEPAANAGVKAVTVVTKTDGPVAPLPSIVPRTDGGPASAGAYGSYGLQSTRPPTTLTPAQEEMRNVALAIGRRDLPPSRETVNAASLLLDRGAHLEARTPRGRGALSHAAETKNAGVARVILQKRKVTQAQLDEAIGWAPLMQDNDVIALLLAAGADVNELARSTFIRPGYDVAAEAAARARFRGERDLLRLLVRSGLEVKGRAGAPSALGIAAPDAEFVELLLAHGADPDHQDANGDTPLLHATRVPREQAPDPVARLRSVQLLLAAGADPRISNKAKVTPAMQSLRDEDALVEALLARGGTIHIDERLQQYYRSEGTPVGAISWAVLNDKDALGAGLLARAGEVDADDCGAVFYAAATGSARTLSALLDRHVPAGRTRDREGRFTPLMGAASGGHLQTVKILLDRRVGPIDEATPLRPGTIGGHGPPMPALIGGDTALMYAVLGGRREVARELLRRGADPERRNGYGDTPLSRAQRAGFASLSAWLADARR